MMTKKLLLALLWLPIASIGQTIPSGAAIDAQVKKIMSRTHANGMAVAVVDKGKVGYVNNFCFIEPDQKLHIHFDPGTRYSYSGEGFILLQFVIEHGRKAQGLGLDVRFILGDTGVPYDWEYGDSAGKS